MTSGAPPTDLEIRIIESPRRKKTVSARIVGDRIEIRLPQGLARAQREKHVAELTTKLMARRSAEVIDLSRRAIALAREFDLPEPATITWSSRQNTRWGSCTPATGAVRISERLGRFPTWVLDYVIVHELAHLIEPNHSARFHGLVARYPRAERAEGFLAAVSLGHAGTLSGLEDAMGCTDSEGDLDG